MHAIFKPGWRRKIRESGKKSERGPMEMVKVKGNHLGSHKNGRKKTYELDSKAGDLDFKRLLL